MDTKRGHLAKTFGDLSLKEQADETLKAMIEILIKAGFDQESLDKIITQQPE